MKSPNNFLAVFTPKSIAFWQRTGIRQLKLMAMNFLWNFVKHFPFQLVLTNESMKLRFQPMRFSALFLLFTLAFFPINSSQAADLKVCKTCNYKTVTAAVKAAKPNDRILVQQGYYA